MNELTVPSEYTEIVGLMDKLKSDLELYQSLYQELLTENQNLHKIVETKTSENNTLKKEVDDLGREIEHTRWENRSNNRKDYTVRLTTELESAVENVRMVHNSLQDILRLTFKVEADNANSPLNAILAKLAETVESADNALNAVGATNQSTER